MTIYVKGIAILIRAIIPINIKNKNNSINSINCPVEVFFFKFISK